MPATLVFDLDGTLVDTAPDLAATMNVLLARHGRRTLPGEDVRGLVGRGARILMARAFERTGDAADEALLERLYDEFLRHYSDNLANHSSVFPGVGAALERLAAAGHRLAVCTNKPEAPAKELLARFGLARFFAVVLGGDSLDVRKPDPDHIQVAVERAGGRRGNAVMIGDSTNDLEAARAARIPMIAVSFGYCEPPIATHAPDGLIDHFDELDAALAKLVAA